MQMINMVNKPKNYHRKYKTKSAHKAIGIIHEMYDRNVDEMPGEFKLNVLIYWQALRDSINLNDRREMLQARRDILGVNADDNMIPDDGDGLSLDHSWSFLTDVPYTEWRRECVSLWRDIRDHDHTRERFAYHLRKLGSW